MRKLLPQAKSCIYKPLHGAVEMTKDMKRFKNVISENRTIKQWPSKSLLKQMALIYIWSKLDQDRTYTSKEISEAIDSMIEFGDFALIRRELFDRGYLDRTADGREYRAKQKKLNINEQEILDFLDGS